MRGIINRVGRAIRTHRLITHGDRVAVAVSGGSDSVALVWLLRDLAARPDANFSIVGLIHLNHGLRGEESSRDEAFCRALAGRLGWPIEVGAFDVKSEAATVRRSLESVARDARYRFFAAAAARLDARRVAMGHTLDDHAETVLLRLFRGAGPGGAAGIPWSRSIYIRPLLDCRRQDLRTDLAHRGEPFLEDSSNTDRSIPRNRLRHEVMPAIAAFAPAAPRALARFAALSRDDDSYLRERAIEVAPEIVLVNRESIELVTEKLAALDASVARRVIRWALEQMPADREPALSARHVEAIRRLAMANKPGGRLDLPSVTASRGGHVVTLQSATTRQEHQAQPFERVLDIPGEVDVPEAGVTISAARIDAERDATHASGRGNAALVQQAALRFPLVVRNRRPGDRLRLLGAPGRRKLQDVFVDRKVPKHRRECVPVVVDSLGRIVWVVGHGIADECRVTAPEAGVVLLKVQTLETRTRP
jgi:tRNA(Ile)-lysidine synthase